MSALIASIIAITGYSFGNIIISHKLAGVPPFAAPIYAFVVTIDIYLTSG